MEAAEGLYNQLEEEVHDLVSQSNSCLERLEFLRKVRELEAEFGKVSGAAPGAGQSQSPPGTAPQSCPGGMPQRHFHIFPQF